MDVPFNGFELTFIVIAFIVFSLFSLASVCFQPQSTQTEEAIGQIRKSKPTKKKQRVITKQARKKP